MKYSAVAYGGGTNSTAMLIGFVDKGIKPDVILFADTKAERPDTYVFIDIFSKWLVDNGLPEITIVERGEYTTKKGVVVGNGLEKQCHHLKSLPSIAYGFKSCSDNYKMQPQHRFIREIPEVKEIWEDKKPITKYVGFDNDEWYRVRHSIDWRYINEFPLVDWAWGRKECVKAIADAGLPQPKKSSCFFCPSMRKNEILAMNKVFPDLVQRAIKIEENAELDSIKGLGRNYSWKELIEADGAQQSMFDESGIELICGCYDG
tara:strand:- start:10 stop:792 length:783 start_codon:yes stop_codon:yes gene_type:complete